MPNYRRAFAAPGTWFFGESAVGGELFRRKGASLAKSRDLRRPWAKRKDGLLYVPSHPVGRVSVPT
jgi:hypothetical protein